MRTSETHAEQEILRYVNAGYSLKSAIFQVKSLTLHRNDRAVDRAADKIKGATNV